MTNRKIKYQPIDPKIKSVVNKIGDEPEALLEIYQKLQDDQGFISRQEVLDVSKVLKLPAQRAYGVATFYSMLTLEAHPQQTIRVCDGPVCWLKHAAELRPALADFGKSLGWKVERTSCLGLCDRAPALLIDDEQAGPIEREEIKSLPEGYRGGPTNYATPRLGEVRIMLAEAGSIDPDSLESALSHAGYQGLRKTLKYQPDQVIDEVEASGLTGRGGAGFPVGRKWRFVAGSAATPRYVICNADESEPLIFKDRVLIDTNPHQILEGMAIAGYATGAEEAYIYIRGEYLHQAERLEKAISQAESAGYLGEQILGSDFSFRIHVHRGAGAYICGEETALIESLEGKRGEPRYRPPYPPTYGFRGLPTLVNNVESYAAVPSILRNGANWYRSIQAPASGEISSRTPGTKLYMILGHINKPGLFEAPFGLTLRQVINDFGGGMLNGSKFHFALTGGAAGTIVPEHLLDIPVDYESASQGISLGAGAFLVCDQTVSTVRFLRELLHFFSAESCGKCTPCRIGTFDSLQILNRLVEGSGRERDIDDLRSLAELMQQASLCGLGQSVAIPIKSALKQFPQDFLAVARQSESDRR